MYFCSHVLPRPVVLSPWSLSVTLIAGTGERYVFVVIVGLQMWLSSLCPNVGSMHLAFKGLVSGLLANKTLQSHAHKMNIGLMLGKQKTNHSFSLTLLGSSTMT